MGRAPCCEKIGLRRGRWTAEEDKLLSDYIQAHGEGSWRSLPKNAGLLRCGKSCRLRWINYLRSDVKRGNISTEEEDLIIKLHASLGNRWSLIAGHLAGRTDNEIKNYWNSHLSRKISPPSPTTIIPTKRRSSALKSRKPRKTSSKRTKIDKQSNTNPSGDGSSVGEPIPDSFPSVGEIENNVLLDDFFDEEGQLNNVDPNGVLNLTDQQNVINDINLDVENSGQIVESGSASSSTNDSNEGKEFGRDWEWECDRDFEIGNNMVGLGLGGAEEEDDIMSWPWVESPTQVVGVDLEKQDAMIAWLLS